MARREPPRRTLPRWARPLPAVAVFAVIVGVAQCSVQSDVESTGRTEQAQREAFMAMRLPQAIARCRELLGPRREAKPVAAAWQPGRLDWYELRDFDRRVMRLVSCDGAQVSEGAGVPRVWADRLPPVEDSDEAQAALFQRLEREPDDGVQALEVALDPQPGDDPPWVQRRWVSGSAQPDDPRMDELPRLFAAQPPGLPSAPLLSPLPTIAWAKSPQAAFEQLARHVPPDARVVRVEIGMRRLDVAIAGPLPGDEAGRASPYGELSFDEFGAPSAPSWRATDSVHGGCAWGRPLPGVRDAFWAEWPRDPKRVVGARFGCGRTVVQGIELDGKWQIHLQARRRGSGN